MNDSSLDIPPVTDSDRPSDSHEAALSTQVLLVTGMSGAGKTLALKNLEDLGYEAVDNIPLTLLPSLASPAQAVLPTPRVTRPVAIGVDIRTRDFTSDEVLQQLQDLVDKGEQNVKLVFLDCDDDELQRRYTETRRRHPLAQDRPVLDGIQQERRLISSLRNRADVVIDTTGRKQNALRQILKGYFALEHDLELTVFVTSFAFRGGLPREADLVFDVRFLRNPYYEEELRALTGLDTKVGDYISKDEGFTDFLNSLKSLLEPLLPRYVAEGKSYLTIAVGCTGGQHRSVFIATQLAGWLEGLKQKVRLGHRELGK
ncbi:MAG: RNase adapter RapZ [Rhodospirillales bacterium]